jgi:3-oxoacyl-[acyl-carrier-protein] synthase II
VSGLAVLSAFGPGADPLLAAALAGRPAFAPVGRFDVSGRRVKVAACAPGSPDLAAELVRVVGEACDEAGLSGAQRAATPLFLAVHGDPAMPRIEGGGAAGWPRPQDPDPSESAEPSDSPHSSGADGAATRPASGALLDPHSGPGGAAFAEATARRAGLASGSRAYTSACVAASTAVGDAAALIARGLAERVVVAAGYLVEADQFSLFDAGKAMAADGRVRPFSADRRGLLLGDAVCAVVLESTAASHARGRKPLARIAGWGRAGDAYHVVRPRPDGDGLARAIAAALQRGGVTPDLVDYINAHGSGSANSDAAEAAALRLALGEAAATIPLSSTKSSHGQALEAGALIELVVTIAALRAGRLPLNGGYLGADPGCAFNFVLDDEATLPDRAPDYALSVNLAFGGANTALLVGAP